MGRHVCFIFFFSLLLLFCSSGELNTEQIELKFSGGGGNFKLVMIQSSHRFGLAASSPNMPESILVGWGCGPAAPAPAWLRHCSQRTRQIGFRQIWLLAVDQTGWRDCIMFAVCWGSARSPGAASSQECSWGAPPPDPRWGSAPDPVGAPPQTPFSRGSGAGAPSGV